MNKEDLSSRLLLLQVNDALFPIGAYSHSYGLETYIQEGRVRDAKTAGEYISRKLALGTVYTDLLAVRLACEKAKAGGLEALDELEDTLEASLVPRECREAFKKLGNRFAKTVSGLPIPWKTQVFGAYVKRRGEGGVCHPCAYGVFCAGAGIPAEDAMLHYLYAQTSAMVTNCVKAVPLSQTEGQKILTAMLGDFPGLLKQAKEAPEEMLGLGAPGFDLAGIRHETLYSRLYMS